MGQPSRSRHDEQQRSLLAQAAARLIAESGLRDFSLARRKAAAQLNIHQRSNLPSDAEIDLALREYQRLYQHHQQTTELHQLRLSALQAMQRLQRFKPQLVGPVLDASANRHTPITLHLFADTVEEVAIFLMEQHIPFSQEEVLLHFGRGTTQRLPLLRFIAGDSELELILFTSAVNRSRPRDPHNNQPMPRADRTQLQQLLEEE